MEVKGKIQYYDLEQFEALQAIIDKLYEHGWSGEFDWDDNSCNHIKFKSWGTEVKIRIRNY